MQCLPDIPTNPLTITVRLKGGAQVRQTRRGNEPRPQKNSLQKFQDKKLLTNTYLLCFTIDEEKDLTKDCSTKTGGNRVRRHKLTSKDGNINILDSRDFVQFFNQRVSDLNHVVGGKRSVIWRGEFPEHTDEAIREHSSADTFSLWDFTRAIHCFLTGRCIRTEPDFRQNQTDKSLVISG